MKCDLFDIDQIRVVLSNDLPKFKPFLSNPLAENKDEMNTFKSGTNHKDDKFRGTKNVSLSVIALFRFNIVLDWVKGRKKRKLLKQGWK